MSLLDLLKDKPPAVSVGDVSWPAPVKDVCASSSSAAAAPFLSSSPLFAAKRTPTLREFLHPNYRDRREEQKSDSTRDASDSRLGIERCKTSGKFSKPDLDSQRMRSKTLSNLHSKNSRNHSEENLEKLEIKDTKKTVVTVDKKLNILDSCSLESKKNKCLFSGLSVLSNLISSTKRDEMKEEIPQGVTNGNDILASSCESTTDPSITLEAAVNVGKHENMMLDDNNGDGHAFPNVNKVSQTKRKASEVVSEEDEKEMIEKMKKSSQEYASSITPKEKVTDVHLSDKLPLRQEGSDDKDNKFQIPEVNNDIDVSASSICDHENPTNTEMTLENEKTGVEKQDNMMINDDGYSINTNQISKTKRKLSEVISEEYDTDMNKKVKKNSQDYFSGITSEEKVTNVQQELSMTQKNSDDKDTEWKMATMTTQKTVFPPKDSDDKVQKLHSKTDKYSSQKHPEEPADKESQKQELNFRDDNCNTTNNDQNRSTAKMREEQFYLKANETCTTQIPDQEDSSDDLKEGKELTLKADISKASSNDNEKSINIIQKDQKLLLKTDACSTQSNACQQSSNNKLQEEQGLSLNVDICSTEGRKQQECTIKIHMEDGLTLKTDTGPHTDDEKNSSVCLESNEKMCLDDKRVIDSLSTTKENLTTVNSTAHQKDGPEDSLSNIKSRAKPSTENMEDVTVKNPQKSAQLDIPKRATITLSQKIIKACSSFHMQMLSTDTSESSSAENEAYETAIKQDFKVLEKNCKIANQNDSSEYSLSDDKSGVKVKNFTEMSSDFQKEFPINKCSSHQETTPLDILPSTDNISIIVDRTAMDSDSEDTISSDDEEDMQDNLKYEVDEKFLEVLVFPDSDDDDDGLEDGEISSDSGDESSEGVDTGTVDKDPSNESKDSMNGKPSAALLKRSRSSTKNRKKRKRKRLLKQGKKMGKNLPTKKAKIDESTKKKLKEPSDNQSKILEPSETQNKKPVDEDHDGFSLLSTLKRSAVLDVTVAASEKELIKKKTRGGKVSAKKRKKLQKRMNEYMARKAEERRKWEARMAPLRMPVCLYYLNGTCNKGDDCQFRHEGTRPKKPQLCKYYVCGVCEKGDECLYQHDPCKYFHFGSRSCSHGDKCRFSHDAPTTETQVLFDQLRADLAQENTKPTDEVGVSQNSVVVSTKDSNLPSNTPAKDSEDLYHLRNRSVKKTPYTIRYSSIDQQEGFGEGCSAAQEDMKVDKGPSNNEKPEQQDTTSSTSTPSYIVPGMYPG